MARIKNNYKMDYSNMSLAEIKAEIERINYEEAKSPSYTRPPERKYFGIVNDKELLKQRNLQMEKAERLMEEYGYNYAGQAYMLKPKYTQEEMQEMLKLMEKFKSPNFSKKDLEDMIKQEESKVFDMQKIAPELSLNVREDMNSLRKSDIFNYFSTPAKMLLDDNRRESHLSDEEYQKLGTDKELTVDEKAKLMIQLKRQVKDKLKVFEKRNEILQNSKEYKKIREEITRLQNSKISPEEEKQLNDKINMLKYKASSMCKLAETQAIVDVISENKDLYENFDLIKPNIKETLNIDDYTREEILNERKKMKQQTRRIDGNIKFTDDTAVSLYKVGQEIQKKEEERILGEKRKELINQEPSKEAQKAIKDFKKMFLDNSSIPDKYKEQMLLNLNRSVKDFSDRECFGVEYMGANGVYDHNKLKLALNARMSEVEKTDVFVHEMLHGASTTIDEHGNMVKDGFSNSDFSVGAALTEGATEYFANKMLKENGVELCDEAYPEIVSIVEDLNNLYGEHVIFDAYMNSSEKLEELMKKDGISFKEFIDITDDYKRETYDKYNRAEQYKKESVQKQYEKIGQMIETIKENRRQKNPDITLKESEWKKSYRDVLGVNEFKKGIVVDKSELIEKPKIKEDNNQRNTQLNIEEEMEI